MCALQRVVLQFAVSNKYALNMQSAKGPVVAFLFEAHPSAACVREMSDYCCAQWAVCTHAAASHVLRCITQLARTPCVERAHVWRGLASVPWGKGCGDEALLRAFTRDCAAAANAMDVSATRAMVACANMPLVCAVPWMERMRSAVTQVFGVHNSMYDLLTLWLAKLCAEHQAVPDGLLWEMMELHTRLDATMQYTARVVVARTIMVHAEHVERAMDMLRVDLTDEQYHDDMLVFIERISQLELAVGVNKTLLRSKCLDWLDEHGGNCRRMRLVYTLAGHAGIVLPAQHAGCAECFSAPYHVLTAPRDVDALHAHQSYLFAMHGPETAAYVELREILAHAYRAQGNEKCASIYS